MLVEFKDAHLSRQLNGVLDAFPTLEVCLPHAGGVLPILIGRWDQGHRVRSECRHLSHPPSYYLRRFTYDTVSHSDAVMEYLVRLVGAERIMLGSDYLLRHELRAAGGNGRTPGGAERSTAWTDTRHDRKRICCGLPE